MGAWPACASPAALRDCHSHQPAAMAAPSTATATSRAGQGRSGTRCERTGVCALAGGIRVDSAAREDDAS